MTAARCPTCDREGANCPTLETLVRGTLAGSEVRRIAHAAMNDCRAHAVDWRARALAAERLAEEAAAHGAGSDALIDAICQRVGARDTGSGGQTVEAGEMRRRVDLTRRVDLLTADAARWQRVAPLIEQLRAWSDAPPPIVSAVVREIIASIDDRASAPEGATP